MDTITELRREIERTLVPYALSRGFVVDRKQAPDFLNFRRCSLDKVEMFDIQWDKNGRPRFTVNFGSCPPGGLSIRGTHYAAEEVSAGWHGVSHGRLQPTTGLKQSWFGQDDPQLEGQLADARLHTPGELVGLLLDLLREVETYWTSGTVGPHLRMMPRRPKDH